MQICGGSIRLYQDQREEISRVMRTNSTDWKFFVKVNKACKFHLTKSRKQQRFS